MNDIRVPMRVEDGLTTGFWLCDCAGPRFVHTKTHTFCPDCLALEDEHANADPELVTTDRLYLVPGDMVQTESGWESVREVRLSGAAFATLQSWKERSTDDIIGIRTCESLRYDFVNINQTEEV